jgi:putative membrane protein
MMHWGDYGWGMGLGWLFMIIFWVLIILGVVYLIKLISRGGRKKQLEEAPLEILKRTYAKREINREEYEKMRDDLKRE